MGTCPQLSLVKKTQVVISSLAGIHRHTANMQDENLRSTTSVLQIFVAFHLNKLPLKHMRSHTPEDMQGDHTSLVSACQAKQSNCVFSVSASTL